MSKLQGTDESLNAPGLGDQEQGDKQIPLLSGLVQADTLPEADGFDVSGARGGQFLSQGTLLILIVAGLAALAIYFMRASQAKAPVDAQFQNLEAKIEQALVQLANPKTMQDNNPLLGKNMAALFENTDAVLNNFTEDVAQHQIPLAAIKKNPFSFALDSIASEKEPGGAMEDSGAALRRKLETEFQLLRLDTVVQGARPMAFINGKLVQPGDKIGSFAIAGIDGLTVKLEAAGNVFILKMNDESSKSK